MNMRLVGWLLAGWLLAIVWTGAEPAVAVAQTDSPESGAVELQEGFVDSDGVRIHYVTAGRGPLLVMIHAVEASVRE